MDIRIQRQTPKLIQAKKDSIPYDGSRGGLGFGKYFTAHMFHIDGVVNGQGVAEWSNPRIVPYGPLLIDPAAKVLHYGVSCFEGQKAYTWEDGSVRLFRPKLNAQRKISSARKIEMFAPSVDMQIAGINRLVDFDRDFLPRGEGETGYVRAWVMGMTPELGVSPGSEFLYSVIISPVGSYFKEGFKPLPILVTDEYTRAAPKGVGDAKAAGNYAGSLAAGAEAKRQGCAQALFLDACGDGFIEEVGAMNVFWVRKFGNDIIYETPSLKGTILPGITRKSALDIFSEKEFMAQAGITHAEEADISIDELIYGIQEGTILEFGGTGTAAAIASVGSLKWDGHDHIINPGIDGTPRVGLVTQYLYDLLTGIQFGKREDPFGWMVEVPEAETVVQHQR